MYNNLLLMSSKLVLKYFSKYFVKLRQDFEKTNLEYIFELYVGKMALYSVLAFFVTFVALQVLLALMGFGLFWLTVLFSFIISIIICGSTIAFSFIYPYHKLEQSAKNIEANLPFAINQMSAVASSGAPPSTLFEFLAKSKEYEDVSKECAFVMRNIKVLGMDITTAIREVAVRTPSKKFAELLYGIVSEITGGGDLNKYLNQSARDAMLEYKISRDKYLTLLNTYAELYTAILIVAPLLFISLLAIMSVVGGQIVGMDIPFLMKAGIYLILPALNIIFLIFVHATQPKT
ncbi:MAG: type II secretion system F family protein [Candidatus Aenigmatarchaeota archaeon]